MKTYLPSLYGNRKSWKVEEFEVAWFLARSNKDMQQDERLMAVAQEHAEFLAQRSEEEKLLSMHIGENGSTANERVRASGFILPDWYREVGNTVESCASHWQAPADAVAMLLDSPPHRAHLLGEGFFASHTVYGIGNAHDYYVLLTCPATPDVSR